MLALCALPSSYARIVCLVPKSCLWPIDSNIFAVSYNSRRCLGDDAVPSDSAVTSLGGAPAVTTTDPFVLR